MGEFEDALLKQRPNCDSGSRLRELLDNRNKSHIQRRLSELEGYNRIYSPKLYFKPFSCFDFVMLGKVFSLLENHCELCC